MRWCWAAARRLDESVIPLNRDTLRQQLTSGSPRIALDGISQERGTTVWHAIARTRLLRDGEELAVARRLREVFRTAKEIHP